MNEELVPSDGTASEAGYLSRLVDLLELLCDEEAAPSYRQLAQQAGLPLSTTHRLVGLLLDKGLCDRNAQGRVVPGYRLVRMGLSAMDRLGDLRPAEAEVRTLSLLTSESVSFGLVVGSRIVLVARHESDHVLRAVAKVGDVIAPHTSAMGKAIMAYLPPPRKSVLMEKALGTAGGKVLAELETELAEIHADGFSKDEEQFTPGLRCRAAPVFGRGGQPVGAVSISGPASRFSLADAQSRIADLKEACSRLSKPWLDS
jgi:IclR family transcriptional regulator, acetate operon repressor